MEPNNERTVEASLSAEEYVRFRSIADQEGETIEEALREVVREYIAARMQSNTDDPFLSYEPPTVDGESITAAKTDEFLYDK